jgi:hypothetical protein
MSLDFKIIIMRRSCTPNTKKVTMYFYIININGLRYIYIYEVFGLMNHSIQNEMVHYESIPQIWWNNSISRISTKQLIMRNEVVMNELTSFHKPNKKVRSGKMMD